MSTISIAQPVAPTSGRHRKAASPTTVKVRFATQLFRSATTTLLLIAAVFALLFMTVGPRVLHYRTATMLTGSMVPTIKPGDVILDTQEPVQDVAVGQIITYHIPVDDHRVESHRVVWVGHDPSGHVLVRTKGDANPIADPWTAQLGNEPVWRVRSVIPMAGTVIRTLRTPLIHLVLVLVLPVMLIAGLLFSIWSPAEKSAAEPNRSARKDDRDRSAASRRLAHLKRAPVGGGDSLAGRQSDTGAGDVGAQPYQGQ